MTNAIQDIICHLYRYFTASFLLFLETIGKFDVLQRKDMRPVLYKGSKTEQ